MSADRRRDHAYKLPNRLIIIGCGVRWSKDSPQPQWKGPNTQHLLNQGGWERERERERDMQTERDKEGETCRQKETKRKRQG